MRKRLFVALPLPERVKKILVQLQRELKKKVNKNLVKWVEEENFHQNLIFLGRVDQKKISQVKKAISDLVDQRVLKLSLGKIGFFPDNKRPRVIWVGVGGEVNRLTSCCHQLRMNLQSFGLRFDTRFTPHITLGRVRQVQAKSIISPKEFNRIQEDLKEDEISFEIRRIILYESKLTPKGPIYTPVYQLQLTD